MRVEDLKLLLNDIDENLEVCVMKNAGQGYGMLPFPIKMAVKEVPTYENANKKMLIIE